MVLGPFVVHGPWSIAQQNRAWHNAPRTKDGRRTEDRGRTKNQGPRTKDHASAELNPTTAQPIIRSSAHRKELGHEDVSLGDRSSRRAEPNGRGAVSARQSGHERAGTAAAQRQA